MPNNQEMSNNQPGAAEQIYALCITCQHKTVKPPNQLCSQCIFHIPQPAPKFQLAAAPAARAPEKQKPVPFMFRDAIGPLTPEFVPPNKKGDVLMIPGRLPYVYK